MARIAATKIAIDTSSKGHHHLLDPCALANRSAILGMTERVATTETTTRQTFMISEYSMNQISRESNGVRYPVTKTVEQTTTPISAEADMAAKLPAITFKIGPGVQPAGATA